MDESSALIATIQDRCHRAIQMKYIYEVQHQAVFQLDTELGGIRQRGFEDSLIQFVQQGDRLRRNGMRFHLIGSGASSIIFFLLGMSEVDPMRHHLPYHRFWHTANEEPPRLQFVVLDSHPPDGEPIRHPMNMSVHPMTVLESIPARLEKQLSEVPVTQSDETTFLTLQAGSTDGIFQLESDEARRLLAQVQPKKIQELAVVTALVQIGHSRPEVGAEWLHCLQSRSGSGSFSSTGNDSKWWERPILFQEAIMNLLRWQAQLPWEETYRFIQDASKNRMTNRHELWKPVCTGLEQHFQSNAEKLLQKLIRACRWAVCGAHHLANAITSYKAAYFRTHHPEEFELTRYRIVSTEKSA